MAGAPLKKKKEKKIYNLSNVIVMCNLCSEKQREFFTARNRTSFTVFINDQTLILCLLSHVCVQGYLNV